MQSPLVEALLKLEHGEPSQKLLGFLKQIMVDDVGKGTGTSIIVNTAAANVLFSLLPKCTPEDQRSLIQSIHSLATSSICNAAVCAESGLVDSLLTILLDLPSTDPQLKEILGLLAYVAGCSIAMQDLMKFLLLIESAPNHTLWASYIETLYRIAISPHNKMPTAFFSFTGMGSGLVIRDVPFPTKGYTFATRIWLSTLQEVNDWRNAPRLFSFCSPEAEIPWMEVVIQGESIVLLVHQGKSYSPLATASDMPGTSLGTIHPFQWHKIVVIHEYRMLGSSTLTLVVDDEVVLKTPFSYPSVREKEGTLYIATDSSGNALQGAIEGAWFFNEALVPLNGHDSYYQTCMAPVSMPKLSATVLPTYCSKTGVVYSSHVSAEMLGTTTRSHHLSPFMATLENLGKIHVWCNLFQRIATAAENLGSNDQQIASLSTSPDTSPTTRSSVHSDAGSSCPSPYWRSVTLCHDSVQVVQSGLNNLIKLLRLFIAQDSSVEKYFTTSGWQILSGILMSIPSILISVEVVGSLIQLQNSIQSESCLKALYNDIYFKPGFWQYCSPQAQKVFFSGILAGINTHFCRWFRKTIGIERILDLLLFDFGIGTSRTPPLPLLPSLHNTDPNAHATLAAQQLFSIKKGPDYVPTSRPHIIRLLLHLVTENDLSTTSICPAVPLNEKPQPPITPEEVQSFMMHLLLPDVTEPELKDLLGLLDDLLSEEHPSFTLLELLGDYGGLHVALYPFLCHSSEVIRGLSLRCMALYLHHRGEHPNRKKECMEHLAILFCNGIAQGKIQVELKTWHTLRDILIMTGSNSTSFSQSLGHGACHSLPAIHILTCIFAVAGSLSLRERLIILRGLLELLKATPMSIALFPQGFWQRNLFMLAKSDEAESLSPGERTASQILMNGLVPDANTGESRTGLSSWAEAWDRLPAFGQVITSILQHLLEGTHTLPDGWRFLADTYVLLLPDSPVRPSPHLAPPVAVISFMLAVSFRHIHTVLNTSNHQMEKTASALAVNFVQLLQMVYDMAFGASIVSETGIAIEQCIRCYEALITWNTDWATSLNIGMRVLRLAFSYIAKLAQQKSLDNTINKAPEQIDPDSLEHVQRLLLQRLVQCDGDKRHVERFVHNCIRESSAHACQYLDNIREMVSAISRIVPHLCCDRVQSKTQSGKCMRGSTEVEAKVCRQTAKPYSMFCEDHSCLGCDGQKSRLSPFCGGTLCPVPPSPLPSELASMGPPISPSQLPDPSVGIPMWALHFLLLTLSTSALQEGRAPLNAMDAPLETYTSVAELLMWLARRILQDQPCCPMCSAFLGSVSLHTDIRLPDTDSPATYILDLLLCVGLCKAHAGRKVQQSDKQMRHSLITLTHYYNLHLEIFDAWPETSPEWAKRLNYIMNLEETKVKAYVNYLEQYTCQCDAVINRVVTASTESMAKTCNSLVQSGMTVRSIYAKHLRRARDATCLQWWISSDRAYTAVPPLLCIKSCTYTSIPVAGTKDLFWILDDCETPSRMRFRLKRNWGGTRLIGSRSSVKKEGGLKEALQAHGQQSQPWLPDSVKVIAKGSFESDDEKIGERTDRDEDSEMDEHPSDDHHIPGFSADVLNTSGLSVESTMPPFHQTSQYRDIVEDPHFDNASKKQDLEPSILKFPCHVVTALDLVPGTFTLNYLWMGFDPDDEVHSKHVKTHATQKAKYMRHRIHFIERVYHRRYLLQYNSIEIRILYPKRRAIFFYFPSAEHVKKIFTQLGMYYDSRMLVPLSTRRQASSSLARLGVTQKWINRQISNLEYIMELNTLSGRSYNDLNQYPIFPWVISDYSSSTLDLSSVSTYRDLSKPVGVLNQRRVLEARERYSTMKGGGIPPFHYGSHYSHSGTILFFLIRLEPYATLQLEWQGGTWDMPDRLFHSVPETFANLLASPTDVKELIPEFYCMPDFLLNKGGYDFGTRHDGQIIGDVILPPWAADSSEFININRMALESEFVSQHLHLWVDLIFGDRQTGAKAEESFNVFHYLTYESNALIPMEDPVVQKSIEAQICGFGQTPKQLFRNPHPKRPLDETHDAMIALARSAPSSTTYTNFNSRSRRYPLVQVAVSSYQCSVLALFPRGHQSGKVTILCVTSLGNLSKHYLHLTSGNARIEVGEEMPLPRGSAWSTLTFQQKHQSSSTWQPTKRPVWVSARTGFDVPPAPQCMVVTNDGKLMFSVGHLSNGIKVSAVARPHKVLSFVDGWHTDMITCIAKDSTDSWLVTGSKDCMVMVWAVIQISDAPTSAPASKQIVKSPVKTLRGHSHPVAHVAVASELDTVASAGLSGAVLIHTLKTGKLVRVIRHPLNRPITKILLSTRIMAIVMYAAPLKPSMTDILPNIPNRSLIVDRLRPLTTQSAEKTEVVDDNDACIHVFTINGDLLASTSLPQFDGSMIALSCMGYNMAITSANHTYVYYIPTLERIGEYHLPSVYSNTITSVCIIPDDTHLLLGLDNATYLVYPFQRHEAAPGK